MITFIASLLWGYTTAARDVTTRAYRTAETWRHAQRLQLPVADNTTPAPDGRKRDVCFTELLLSRQFVTETGTGKVITFFFRNFPLSTSSKNKTFPELEKFPHCGESFWRNILSSMLQILLFLPTEQFSTFFHKFLSSEYSNRHRSETQYNFLSLKHYILYTVEGIVNWKCSGLLSEFFRNNIWIFVFLIIFCLNTVGTATCSEMDSMRN